MWLERQSREVTHAVQSRRARLHCADLRARPRPRVEETIRSSSFGRDRTQVRLVRSDGVQAPRGDAAAAAAQLPHEFRDAVEAERSASAAPVEGKAEPSRNGDRSSSMACAPSASARCFTTRAAPFSVCAARSSPATRTPWSALRQLEHAARELLGELACLDPEEPVWVPFAPSRARSAAG